MLQRNHKAVSVQKNPQTLQLTQSTASGESIKNAKYTSPHTQLQHVISGLNLYVWSPSTQGETIGAITC